MTTNDQARKSLENAGDAYMKTALADVRHWTKTLNELSNLPDDQLHFRGAEIRSKGQILAALGERMDILFSMREKKKGGDNDN